MKNLWIVLLCVSSVVNGANIIWDGGAGTNEWENPLNWNTNVLPGINDDVFITGSSTSILLESEVNVKSVQFGLPTNSNGGLFTISSSGILNIHSPLEYGVRIYKGGLKNSGSINITNGGSNSLTHAALEIHDALGFDNLGNISISGYTGYYGILLDDVGSIFLSGNVVLSNSGEYGLQFDTPIISTASISILSSTIGIVMAHNFTNNGSVIFENADTGVSVLSGTAQIVPNVLFKNNPQGLVHQTDGIHCFSDFKKLSVENYGVMTGDDPTTFALVRSFRNDSIVNVKKQVIGIHASSIINYGSMEFTDGAIFPTSCAFKCEEFENHGEIVVREGRKLYEKSDPFTGLSGTPLKSFQNYGTISGSLLRYGIELDSASFENFENAEIHLDSVVYYGLKLINGYSGTAFNNEGILSVSNQFENDTAIYIGSTAGETFENTSSGKIELTNVKNGMAVSINSADIDDFFDNSGEILINGVSNETGLAFGLLKNSNTSFINFGKIEVSNVQGYGFLIDTDSERGVIMEGEFVGKNNRTSVFINTGLVSNDNAFRVQTTGRVYSRGDSLYSLVDSSENGLGTIGCGVIDVENIIKPENILATSGMVKLNSPGSDFNLYAIQGLLVDPFGEIYPYLSGFNLNNIDVAFGIGGLVSSGITEPNFFKESGYFASDYDGFYLDSARTQSAGTYNNSDGSFTPTFSDPAQTELYFLYTRTNIGCTYEGSLPILQECPFEPIENHFTGEANTDWHEPSNWSLGMVPTVCHKAIIPQNLKAIISGGTKARSAGLETETGAVLDVSNGSVGDFFINQ